MTTLILHYRELYNILNFVAVFVNELYSTRIYKNIESRSPASLALENVQPSSTYPKRPFLPMTLIINIDTHRPVSPP